jgi:hypothetical protein
MVSIINATGCCGFVLKRRHEFEAYNADQKSLGLYETQQQAIDAVLRSGETTEQA